MDENTVSNFENVYTFKNVKFVTTERHGGRTKEWCVSSIEIALVENGIPSIEIRVDPMHVASDSPGASDASGLKVFAEWNRQAQELAQSKARASLQFEVWKKDKLDQSFSVEDWVVTEAGLTTAHDSFELIMVIQHYVVLTNFSGTSISGVVSPESLMIDSVMPAVDMVDVIANTLELYGTATFTSLFTDPPCPDSTQESEVDIAQTFADEMTALASVLSGGLKWNGAFYADVTYAEWPTCGGVLDIAIPHMGFALAKYFWGLRDTNLWDILAQQLVGQWFVSILPTYWQELTITPTTPWAKPSITIDDKDISVAKFPGYERNIIAGVAIYMQGPDTGEGYTAWQGIFGDDALMTDGVVYRLPPVEQQSEITRQQAGALEDKALPDWMISLMKASASAAGEYGAPNQDSSNMVTPSNTPQGSAPDATTGEIYLQSAEDFRCAAYHCAHQIFLTQFKSGTQCNISMRLMISQATGAQNHDDDIIPGKSCRITSQGSDVMDFYITMVVHRIDFAQSVANTTIAGKYVRPPNGFTGLLEITATIPNPVYVTPTAQP